MPLLQSIDHARTELIGAQGVAASAVATALKATQPALAALRARHADGSLPLLRLPSKRDDLAAIREAAARLITGASDIVMLGTGGSSLGGQTPAPPPGHHVPRPGPPPSGPRLHLIA